MKFSFLTVLVLALTVGLASVTSAQSVDYLETKLDSLRMEQSKIDRELNSGQSVLDSLSSEIAKLKSQDSEGELSAIDEYRLAERLRRSQSVADRLDELNAARVSVIDEIGGAVDRLDNRYVSVLDSLSRVLESNYNGEDKERIILKMGQLREKQSRLGDRGLAENVTVVTARVKGLASAVELEADDSPEDILEKADFLHDLSGKLKQRVKDFGRKISDLRGEVELRSRMGEFTQEIALFDQGLARSRTTGTAEAEQKGGDVTGREDSFTPPSIVAPTDDMNGNRGGGSEVDISFDKPATEDITAILDLELYDPDMVAALPEKLAGSLSAENLETAIRYLELRMDSVRVMADSLAEKEKRFRQAADRLKD